MSDQEIIEQWEVERLEQESKAERIYKKIKWHIATRKEFKEYIEIMCLDSLAIEKVPPQIWEFKNAAAFINWTLEKATALTAYLKK